MTRYVIIGGGIVGLAVARRLQLDRPADQVTVLEKEMRWGGHQTGHNSGVIHAGVYYQPGSLKARFCRAGSASMIKFCKEYGIPFDLCGKLIVATAHDELARLHSLHDRAISNGLEAQLIGPSEAHEFEPEVSCVAAIHVPSTGITDFGAVCERLAMLIAADGGALCRGTLVTGVATGAEVIVQTTVGEFRGDVLINCAGLHADRIARMAGLNPPAQIIPFRGEYYELKPERRYLVQGLIYPVPNPDFPFLGVHLTRMVDGGVHAGPNAVLAFAREGYHWGAIRPADMLEALAYRGLWALGRKHLRYGLSEVHRSLSSRRFAASVARLVPSIDASDLVKAPAGVRAQAIARDGSLIDDFLIVDVPQQVHVLNAPSPAATSSLEIARYIVDRLP